MAEPALSWCLPLLIFLLPLATPPVSAEVDGPAQLRCFYNSRANVSCEWRWDKGLPGTACHIRARSDKRSWNKTCELSLVGQATWACNLVLGPPDAQRLTSVDVVTACVMCWDRGRWQMVTTQDFNPFDYREAPSRSTLPSVLGGTAMESGVELAPSPSHGVRLLAPSALRVSHVGTHSCNVTWRVTQVSHYIDTYLEFEARTRSSGHSWEDAGPLSLKQRQQWIHLETLAPGTQYELQVRVRAQRGRHRTWSPWSAALAFRTKPAALGTEAPPLPWFGSVTLVLGLACGLIFFVYSLASSKHLGPWLKKVLKCHIPDPSKFFSQLTSEHGGDFQKWLSSPFPSSSYDLGGPPPEISSLEVLDRDAKATQLLLLQQQQVTVPSSGPGGHTQTSCFTNQGYFFFRLPDALEVEACQVYFTYDPCVGEEGDPVEGVPGGPAGCPLPTLPPAPAEEEAYCTFPSGDDLLLFSPGLPGGPSPPHSAPGDSQERVHAFPQEVDPGDWGPPSLGPATSTDPNLAGFQPLWERALEEAGAGVPVPGPGEEAGPSKQGQLRACPTHPAPNIDAYLSLQEVQAQDPTHSV
ncbi:interleukin-2 receptor subunit beta [Ctenodactylus gundi]